MSQQETQYRAAYRRARIHRDVYGLDGYEVGFLAAALRSEWSERGYIDGWCSQDRDSADVGYEMAVSAEGRA